MTVWQEPRPTVGDTLTVVHHIAAPAGAVVEARAPTDSSIATLVAPPVITREGDSVRIAYTIAVWAPGHNQLVIPGAIVVSMRGHVDTLPDARVPLDVASLLPAGKAANSLAPRPARAWMPRGDESVLPLAILLPLALLVVGGMQWWWRRRSRPLPTIAPPIETSLTAARLDAWLAGGEARLALAHLEWQLRGREDFGEWRARADALRFGAAESPELVALVREGWARVHGEVVP